MNKIVNRIILFKFVLFIGMLPGTLWAKDIQSPEIDVMVKEVMETFSVPGMAVGGIEHGQIIHEKGYGVRSLNDGGAVDENTYFGIASNSKGFTATALALLVEDGKINWND
ncbi:MAG TPA: serine hydrolase domain-containing protein, partial [Emcibacteraceae bacterium]|nr:serine hydrolase domain-containing protein [Emcibacteraceae bacterium]